jgi:hypothetical protein
VSSISVPHTRLFGLSRPVAIVTLVVVVLALLGFLAIGFAESQLPQPAAPKDSDMAMYGRLIDHMRQGEDYYAAARNELSHGHYGMQSVFNWRTPLLPSSLSLLPSNAWAQVLFVLITLATATATCRLVFKEMSWIATGVLSIILILALGTCMVPQAVVFSEFIAGVLILLSASCYGLKLPYLGLAAAALALFVRELSGPYVLLCVYLAWREKRPTELKMWAVVLAGYAVYFLRHYYMVKLHQAPGDLADPAGWVQFGGAQFVLDTATFNGIFLIAPIWVTALLIPASCLGLLAWPSAAGRRMALTVFGYVTRFAILGKSYNDYWGAIYAPMMTVGLVWFPAAIRDLWRDLKSQRAEAGVQQGA